MFSPVVLVVLCTLLELRKFGRIAREPRLKRLDALVGVSYRGRGASPDLRFLGFQKILLTALFCAVYNGILNPLTPIYPFEAILFDHLL